ncbi:MAG: hypothetical protein JSS81_02670 [Acidobacteria bacterium]|nr:hypothetical protein [Acidobacteriota bacterium]
MNKYRSKIAILAALIAAGLALYASGGGEAAAGAGIESSARPKSLCAAREQTIWTCTTTRAKVLSICASKDLAEDRGYVQYRYGVPGKVELEYPKERKDSAQKFRYTRYTRPLVTMLTLSFENDGFSYVLEDDDMEEEKPAVREATVEVTKGAEKTATIKCKTPPAGSLMKLEDIVPRDESN